MQLILGVPSTREVKREPITISDDEEQATTHPTLSLKDRENDILAKFDVINHQLNSKWPTSSQDFRQVIIDYQERFVTRFKKPTRVSQEEKIKIVENHWFMDLTLLGEWINILQIQENVEELLKTVEDATGLQTENDFKTLILFVPSSSTPWQNKIMAAMESCENPLIDTEDSSDENLFNSEYWQRVESNRELVLKQVREFADHVMENKETKPPIKFTIQRTDNDQDLNCHYSLYEAGNLVKDKFDRLPAAPTNVSSNPEIVDGKTEIKWNYEDADPNNFLVRYRKLPQDVWTEEKIINPVFTFRPGPALEFCVAVDTCFGRSKFSPVIQVPELLQQAAPILKKLSPNTVKLEWSPQLKGATSYQIQCKETQVEEPFGIFDAGINTECHLEELKPDTNYTANVVAVFPDGQEMRCAPSEFIQFTTPKKSFAHSMMKRSRKIGRQNDLDLYAVPLDGPTTSNNIERYVINESLSSPPMPHKTIMLMRPVDEDRPMINAMINYIFDVKWEDKFRFQLCEDIEEETSHVTIYKICHSAGLRIPYSLTIIEVVEDAIYLEEYPGPEMVRELIKSNHGIEEVDMVTLAYDPIELSSVLSIFGKDLVNNSNFILKNESQVEDLQNNFLHQDRYFIESKDVFQQNNSSSWEQLKIFFNRLSNTDAVSLLQTKRVLKKRLQCESLLENLRSLIVTGLAKRNELRDAKQNVTRIGNTIRELVNEVNKKKEDWKKVKLPNGRVVSNCRECRVTCHFSTSYATWGCTPCLSCPGKCGSASHSAENYQWKRILLPADNCEEIGKELEIERNSLQVENARVAQLAKIVDELEKNIQEKDNILKRKVAEMNEISFCIPVCTFTGDIGKAIKSENVEFSERAQILRWNCLRSEILDQMDVSRPVLSLMQLGG